MTPTDDRQFPAALAAAMAVPFDYAGGDGVDFEPFATFLSAEETTDWFQAWTGNGELDGDDFRVFGQDGSGGYAAFWLVRPSQPLADQPVVFLGSEGETGVVARDLGDFLWLLAGGFGPWEAATSYEPAWTPRPNQELTAVAERFAPGWRRSPAAVIELAAQEFPEFDDTLMELCR
ncbi:SMI1/KNR4 family protein [Streptomyces sp. NBC_01549]|uniref:SMI1/KNR4 family protein n=1 Tax=unclassified Streptomyces TaxID=2593676 RepID=UPI00225B489C|nr:SMI1/KNR4 family protein [Streptomyces sp. NBC_01549]MCX4597016.1 SMI1/KNR4 family protein [Streptomyces sp. NBC_01549]